ncbi:hypothetical protein HYR99_24015 [Candidatus Poribacteria bacterium]|nr:hypothetical protein [Candidatus Poribacteria bacterium]
MGKKSINQKCVGVTSQIEAVLSWLRSIESIVIPEPAAIRSYLLRYPDMTELLPPVCKLARERFGVHTQLSLEVYRDSEIEDEYLTLYVRQENYDEHILDMIESISAAYEDEVAGKSGWLLVTTDFRSPR